MAFPPDRLRRIDESNRGDHSFLGENDRCFYIGEYFSNKGYEAGETNDLIINFKIEPSALQKNPARRKYKVGAISKVAAGLRKLIPRADAERHTWIAVPPSKIPGHPDHDDRLSLALQEAFAGYNVDVRPVLRQTQSTESDHTADERLTLEELYAITRADPAVLGATPIREGGIVLFDDVLTTGKHFKCGERRLLEIVPGVVIKGVFVARCVRPSAEEELRKLKSLFNGT